MRKQKRRRLRSGPKEFWQSYSDMMAAILLVFVLFLAGSILQSIRSVETKEEELQSKQAELEGLEKAFLKLQEQETEEAEVLLEWETEITDLKTRLDAQIGLNAGLETKLEQQESEIEALNGIIDEKDADLAKKSSEAETLIGKLSDAQSENTQLSSELEAERTGSTHLSEQLDEERNGSSQLSSELDAAKAENVQLSSKLDAEQAENAQLSSELDAEQAANAQLSSELDAERAGNVQLSSELDAEQAENVRLSSELDAEQAGKETLQKELDQILGIRKSLVEELSREFSGTQLIVNLETGAITFSSDLLFEYNSAVLQAEGKKFLESFFPKYVDILMKDMFRDYIAEIIIEGHADTMGTYIYNLDLSQNRALAVASFLLSDEQTLFSREEQDLLRRIVTANGRSWSRPIYDASGNEDKEASRRVEIQFRLKDEEMIRQMADVLD